MKKSIFCVVSFTHLITLLITTSIATISTTTEAAPIVSNGSRREKGHKNRDSVVGRIANDKVTRQLEGELVDSIFDGPVFEPRAEVPHATEKKLTNNKPSGGGSTTITTSTAANTVADSGTFGGHGTGASVSSITVLTPGSSAVDFSAASPAAAPADAIPVITNPAANYEVITTTTSSAFYMGGSVTPPPPGVGIDHNAVKPPPPAAGINPVLAKKVNENSRLVAYVANWRDCPTTAQLENYTHIAIAFAVTYQLTEEGNQCSDTCEIYYPPVCNTSNGTTSEEIVKEWQDSGKKVIVSFGGTGMGDQERNNNCWDYCFGRQVHVINQLVNIVNVMGLDGVDINYEYFFDNNQKGSSFRRGQQAQIFLSDLTEGLKELLPEGSIVTHSPMDSDIEVNSTYFNILKDVADSIDFLMPQYYNGVTRPVLDGVNGQRFGVMSAMEHYGAIVTDIFDGDETKVSFGFCISDCISTGSNANPEEAAKIIKALSSSYPCNGGAFFWETHDDIDGSWSSAVKDASQQGEECAVVSHAPKPVPEDFQYAFPIYLNPLSFEETDEETDAISIATYTTTGTIYTTTSGNVFELADSDDGDCTVDLPATPSGKGKGKSPGKCKQDGPFIAELADGSQIVCYQAQKSKKAAKKSYLYPQGYSFSTLSDTVGPAPKAKYATPKGTKSPTRQPTALVNRNIDVDSSEIMELSDNQGVKGKGGKGGTGYGDVDVSELSSTGLTSSSSSSSSSKSKGKGGKGITGIALLLNDGSYCADWESLLADGEEDILGDTIDGKQDATPSAPPSALTGQPDNGSSNGSSNGGSNGGSNGSSNGSSNGNSDVITTPSDRQVPDCSAIGSGIGPRTDPRASFQIVYDVVIEESANLNLVYNGMQRDLQTNVASVIAGCPSSGTGTRKRRRKLTKTGEMYTRTRAHAFQRQAPTGEKRRLHKRRQLERQLRRTQSGETVISNVAFSPRPRVDETASSCAKAGLDGAANDGGICYPTAIPLSIYYIGDDTDDFRSRIENALKNHVWNVDGLLGVYIQSIDENQDEDNAEDNRNDVTAIIGEDPGNSGVGAMGAVAISMAAFALVLVAILLVRRRSNDDEMLKHVELPDEDEDGTYMKDMEQSSNAVSSNVGSNMGSNLGGNLEPNRTVSEDDEMDGSAAGYASTPAKPVILRNITPRTEQESYGSPDTFTPADGGANGTTDDDGNSPDSRARSPYVQSLFNASKDDEDTSIQEEPSQHPHRIAHVVGEEDSLISGWTGNTFKDQEGRRMEDVDYPGDEEPMEAANASAVKSSKAANVDVHVCSSATCEVCERNRQQGIQFLPAGRTNVIEQSGGLPADAAREYVADDTVYL